MKGEMIESLHGAYRRQVIRESDVSVSPTMVPDRLMIGTHDGMFHCDEVAAIAILKMLPQFATAVVVRTRNPDLLAKCHVVVDVGGVFDPARLRFDHHQRGFHQSLDGSTKLSSAGLVFRHFGRALLVHLYTSIVGEPPDESVLLPVAFGKVYKSFVEYIDLVDNGAAPASAAHAQSLPERVASLNLQWNDPHSFEHSARRFAAAVHMVSVELLSVVRGIYGVWWPARSLVLEAFQDRLSVHPSGNIMVLPNGCPWKEHLFAAEAAASVFAPSPASADAAAAAAAVLFVVYPDSGDSWRAQSVPVSPGSFHVRKAFPHTWLGLHDSALSLITRIDKCLFAHAGGFICGHPTREGAIQLALAALHHH